MGPTRGCAHGIDAIQVIGAIKIDHIKAIVGACAVGWLLGRSGLGEVFVTILIDPVGNLTIGITRDRSFIGGIEPKSRSVETVHRVGSMPALSTFRINIGTDGERAPCGYFNGSCPCATVCCLTATTA